MSNKLAQAIDPVMTHVLETIDQFELGTELPPQVVQRQILDRLGAAELAVGGTVGWDLVRYAVTAWVDEVLLDAHWSGRSWWNNNVLEAELFQTRDCSERFYILAEHARGLPETDALEVFYDCVVLGFRGMYRSDEIAKAVSQNDGLPDNLDAWLRRTSMTIAKRERSYEEIDTFPVGAPPRTARRWLVGTASLLVVLLCLNVLVLQLRGGL